MGNPSWDNNDLHTRVEPRARRCPQPGGLPLNRERLGVLCGNHIRRLARKWIGVSVFTKGAYTLRKNACYADSEKATGSYTETI